MVATLDSPNGAARGYVAQRQGRWRWVEPDDAVWRLLLGLDPDGDDPLDDRGERPRFEIRTNLTFGEMEELGESPKFVDIRSRLAPLVRAWNVVRIDAATGEPFAVAPPAEAGPDQLKALEPDLLEWLWHEAKNAPFGGERRGKGGRPRGGSGGPPGDGRPA